MQPKQILSLFMLTLGVTTSDANVLPFGRSINPQDAAGKHLEGRRFTNSSGVEARAVNATVDGGPEKMRLAREVLGLNERDADNSNGTSNPFPFPLATSMGCFPRSQLTP